MVPLFFCPSKAFPFQTLAPVRGSFFSIGYRCRPFSALMSFPPPAAGCDPAAVVPSFRFTPLFSYAGRPHRPFSKMFYPFSDTFSGIFRWPQYPTPTTTRSFRLPPSRQSLIRLLRVWFPRLSPCRWCFFFPLLYAVFRVDVGRFFVPRAGGPPLPNRPEDVLSLSPRSHESTVSPPRPELSHHPPTPSKPRRPAPLLCAEYPARLSLLHPRGCGERVRFRGLLAGGVEVCWEGFFAPFTFFSPGTASPRGAAYLPAAARARFGPPIFSPLLLAVTTEPGLLSCARPLGLGPLAGAKTMYVFLSWDVRTPFFLSL